MSSTPTLPCTFCMGSTSLTTPANWEGAFRFICDVLRVPYPISPLLQIPLQIPLCKPCLLLLDRMRVLQEQMGVVQQGIHSVCSQIRGKVLGSEGLANVEIPVAFITFGGNQGIKRMMEIVREFRDKVVGVGDDGGAMALLSAAAADSSSLPIPQGTPSPSTSTATVQVGNVVYLATVQNNGNNPSTSSGGHLVPVSSPSGQTYILSTTSASGGGGVVGDDNINMNVYQPTDIIGCQEVTVTLSNNDGGGEENGDSDDDDDDFYRPGDEEDDDERFSDSDENVDVGNATATPTKSPPKKKRKKQASKTPKKKKPREPGVPPGGREPVVGLPYKCTICPWTFKTPYTLRNHLITHSSQMPFRCDICLLQFSKPQHVKRHNAEKHGTSKPHKCEKCGKAYVMGKGLRLHMGKHTGEDLTCHICNDGKPFKSRHILKRHMKTHGEEVLLQNQCCFCDRKCTRREDLITHMTRVHRGDKERRSCNICPKEFPDAIQLITHVYTHGSGREVKCHACNITFVTKDDFALHNEERHTLPAERFTCDECDTIMFSARCQAMHKKLHQPFTELSLKMQSINETRTYMCPVCNEEFPTKLAKQHHYNDLHKNDPNKCHKCGLHLESAEALEEHMSYHPADNVEGTEEGAEGTEGGTGGDGKPNSKCDVCKKQFSSLSIMRRHFSVFHSQTSKPFPCNMCDYSTRRKDDLRKHQLRKHGSGKDDAADPTFTPKTRRDRIYDNNPKECEICNKTFNSVGGYNKHLREQHPVEKDTIIYQCYHCSKTYKERKDLKRHLRGHMEADMKLMCDACGVELKTLPGLRKHLKEQHGEGERRPFECDICEKGFKRRDDVRKHVRLVHKGSNPGAHIRVIPVEDRDKRVQERQERKYKKRPDKDKVQCDLCKKYFANQKFLEKHLEEHEEGPWGGDVPCAYCDKVFMKESYLEKHVQEHHTVRVIAGGKRRKNNEDEEGAGGSGGGGRPERKSRTKAKQWFKMVVADENEAEEEDQKFEDEDDSDSSSSSNSEDSYHVEYRDEVEGGVKRIRIVSVASRGTPAKRGENNEDEEGEEEEDDDHSDLIIIPDFIKKKRNPSSKPSNVSTRSKSPAKAPDSPRPSPRSSPTRTETEVEKSRGSPSRSSTASTVVSSGSPTKPKQEVSSPGRSLRSKPQEEKVDKPTTSSKASNPEDEVKEEPEEDSSPKKAGPASWKKKQSTEKEKSSPSSSVGTRSSSVSKKDELEGTPRHGMSTRTRRFIKK